MLTALCRRSGCGASDATPDHPLFLLVALQHFRHCRHEVLLFHVMAEEELRFPFESFTHFKNLELVAQDLAIDPKTKKVLPLGGGGPHLVFHPDAHLVFEEIQALPLEPGTEDVDSSAPDHAYDAMTYDLLYEPPAWEEPELPPAVVYARSQLDTASRQEAEAGDDIIAGMKRKRKREKGEGTWQ